MSPASARLWHLPRLLGILWAFTRATPWLPNARSRWMDAVLMQRLVRRGMVRQVGGGLRPEAFIVRDGAYVHALFVHPRARGRGFGRALVAEAKARADLLELRVLQANAGALAFYEAQGFEEAGRGDGADNDENLPDVCMIWQAEQGQCA